jgi:hypothetical protein
MLLCPYSGDDFQWNKLRKQRESAFGNIFIHNMTIERTNEDEMRHNVNDLRR